MKPTVILADLKARKGHEVCHKGSRLWCAAQGVSWDALCEGRLTIEELEKFNDPVVNIVIENAKIRLGIV